MYLLFSTPKFSSENSIPALTKGVDILHMDSDTLMNMLLDLKKVQITVNHMNNQIQDVTRQKVQVR